MAFDYKVVIENRVCIWFSAEESEGSVVGGRRCSGKRPFVIINSTELSILSKRRPL